MTNEKQNQQKFEFSRNIRTLYENNDIEQFCSKLFLQVKGINYFDYSHFCDDGRSFSICTNREYIKHYYSEGLYITVQELQDIRKIHGLQKKLYGFYARELSIADVLSNKDKHSSNILLGEKFGVDKRFYILKRHHDYMELIGFGSDMIQSIEDFTKVCLENLGVLNSFIGFFKKEQRSLINIFKHNAILTPYTLENHDVDKNFKFFDFKNNRDIYLTCREYQFLQNITHGLSTKEIAHSLGISNRTAEAHINNLKEKFGCNSKSRLVSLLNDLV